MSKLNLNQLQTSNNAVMSSIITSQRVPASAVPVATESAAGIVQPDNSTIIVSGGVISANLSAYATTEALSSAVSGLASEGYVSSYISDGGYVTSSYVSSAIEGKQDILTGSDGIVISNNVVSASVDGTTLYVNSSGQLAVSAHAVAPAPTLMYVDGMTGNMFTIPGISDAALAKFYKNGVLLRPAAGTTGTLEFKEIQDPLNWAGSVTSAILNLTVDGTDVETAAMDLSSAATVDTGADRLRKRVERLAEILNDGGVIGGVRKFYCVMNPEKTGVIFLSPTVGSSSAVNTNASTASEMLDVMNAGVEGNKIVTAGTDPQDSPANLHDYYVDGDVLVLDEAVETYDTMAVELFS